MKILTNISIISFKIDNKSGEGIRRELNIQVRNDYPCKSKISLLCIQIDNFIDDVDKYAIKFNM